MSSASSAMYACFVAHDGAEQLKGMLAKEPLKPGQTIVAHGTHEDGEETGPGVFLVLRQIDSRQYMLAPLGSADEYWESYLSRLPTVRAVLKRKASDTTPANTEQLVRWRIVSKEGEVPKKRDYGDIGLEKPMVEGLSKKWHFLNELVVSEKPPAQVGNDISGNP